jgi:hypothetical protein
MFATVASFYEVLEAYMLRARLEAEGLFAVVHYDQHVGNNWLQAIALGGARVRVLEGEVSAAREIIAAVNAGVYLDATMEWEFEEL